MDKAAMSVYLVCIGALALNLFALAIVTAMRRSRSKTYVNPEDAKAFKGDQATADVPAVLRAAAAHRNAMESFVPFAILGLLFVLTGASQTAAAAYFITFVVARWLHSLFYLGSLQPWRTLAFVVGLLVNLGLTYHVVAAGLG